MAEHRESADLQYPLQPRAAHLGWAASRLLVIDDDQGISDQSVENQPGLRRKRNRLLYDRTADSDPLRKRLGVQQIELVCHDCANRKRPPAQDGRKTRRLKRRYRIERSISGLSNIRRLIVRCERFDHLYLGFVQRTFTGPT